jgi:hypothetical protein
MELRASLYCLTMCAPIFFASLTRSDTHALLRIAPFPMHTHKHMGPLGETNYGFQAREFSASVGVTGIILTKLDGTSRGGAVVSVVDELGIPVKFVGVGEALGDLQPFDCQSFVSSLFPEGDVPSRQAMADVAM